MAHFDVTFFSSALKKNTELSVIIPSVSADDYLFGENVPDYYGEGKFQTLYLLHGSYGDFTDWTLLTSIYRYAQEHCLAVVMPSGENSSYLNMKHGEDYLIYISEELPSFCTTLFPFSTKREDTFIAGLSMGGYGAYRAALQHPETYGAVASLSGNLDKAGAKLSGEAHMTKMPLNYRKAVNGDSLQMSEENDLRFLLQKCLSEKKELPKMYHTIGEDDFLRGPSESYIAFARERGVDIEFHLYPGVHDWKFWDAHIQDVLDWLPLKRGKC
ncbi:MAG: hypothetical protein IKE21_08975 [Erysipelotrichaceae bacterium]|nr:hypothetical protein [Erysipelotrichaceae bacterium]